MLLYTLFFMCVIKSFFYTIRFPVILISFDLFNSLKDIWIVAG